jgi:hypothetical protein
MNYLKSMKARNMKNKIERDGEELFLVLLEERA